METEPEPQNTEVEREESHHSDHSQAPSPDAAPREESQPRRDENGKPQYEYDDGRNARNEGNTLHVSNLSSRTLERDLEDIFSKFGKVTGVKIPVDRYNENRGFGFVTFETNDGAEAALREEVYMGSRVIRCQLSRRSVGYKPTPGAYLGKEYMRFDRRDRYDDRRSRSRSHRRHRSYSRSPSRHHHRRSSHRSRSYDDRRSPRYDRRSYDRSSRDRRSRYRSRS